MADKKRKEADEEVKRVIYELRAVLRQLEEKFYIQEDVKPKEERQSWRRK